VSGRGERLTCSQLLIPLVLCTQPPVVSLHHARQHIGGTPPAGGEQGGVLKCQSMAASCILHNAGRRPALLGKEGERWSARSDGALHLIPCSVTASRSSAHWRDTPRWWGAGWCAEMPIDGCQLHPAQCGPEARAPR
jgi:hypothetical protein